MIDTASHRTRALEYAAGHVSVGEWGESVSGWDTSVRNEAIRTCYWRSAFGVYGAPAHVDVGRPIRTADGDWSPGEKGGRMVMGPFSPPHDGVPLRMITR